MNIQFLRLVSTSFTFNIYAILKYVCILSFTVGCKTEDGFTVILVERGEGVETKPIKTSYSPTAGTAYITFDNVKVPVENTLGEEGGGIFVMLSNFNHERWAMCCVSARAQRCLVEECLKYVLDLFSCLSLPCCFLRAEDVSLTLCI